MVRAMVSQTNSWGFLRAGCGLQTPLSPSRIRPGHSRQIHIGGLVMASIFLPSFLCFLAMVPKWARSPTFILCETSVRLFFLTPRICPQPKSRDVGRQIEKVQEVEKSKMGIHQGLDSHPSPVYPRANLIHLYECHDVVVQVSVDWGLPDVSSEKGLLYYLHEPIYLSKAFGFSTITQGCPPHLSDYRAPLCAGGTGKGYRLWELKDRLSCLCHKLGDLRGGPSNVSLVPPNASEDI